MSHVLRRRWLADLALVGITFIWGATFVVVKTALDSSSTLFFLALRFSLAAVVLALLFRRRLRTEHRQGSAVRAGLLAGGFLFLGYLFQTAGLRFTTPAKSALITGLAVVLVPILSAVLYRSRPGWSCWLGAGLAVAGLYLLTAPAGLAEFARGELLTLIGAVAFSLHILLLGRYSPRVGVASLTLAQVVVAAVLSLACFSWAEPFFVRWTASFLAAVLITGLLATALAFSVQTWAQQFTPSTHAALIFALEPVFAWLTSYVMMGERLGGNGAVGAALMLLGIILSEMKPW
ncbi:MAG: DMT family transporter [Acidobacteria bacterium]|nr:DMT family transporter [Acidobacteriota bacterium]